VILKGLSAIRARKYMHDLPAILFYRAKKMHGARFADSCLWELPRAGKLEIARCTGSQVAVRQLEIIHRPMGTCDDVHRTETVHGATEVCAVIVGFVVTMQNLFRGGPCSAQRLCVEALGEVECIFLIVFCGVVAEDHHDAAPELEQPGA